MWNLTRIIELREAAGSSNWSDVLGLYFFRAQKGDLKVSAMIDRVIAQVNETIEEYRMFHQELLVAPGHVLNKQKSIEFLRVLIQRDEEFVASLQALSNEAEGRSTEKVDFIQKLNGNMDF